MTKPTPEDFEEAQRVWAALGFPNNAVFLESAGQTLAGEIARIREGIEAGIDDHHALGRWPGCPVCLRLYQQDLEGAKENERLKDRQEALLAEIREISNAKWAAVNDGVVARQEFYAEVERLTAWYCTEHQRQLQESAAEPCLQCEHEREIAGMLDLVERLKGERDEIAARAMSHAKKGVALGKRLALAEKLADASKNLRDDAWRHTVDWGSREEREAIEAAFDSALDAFVASGSGEPCDICAQSPLICSRHQKPAAPAPELYRAEPRCAELVEVQLPGIGRPRCRMCGNVVPCPDHSFPAKYARDTDKEKKEEK